MSIPSIGRNLLAIVSFVAGLAYTSSSVASPALLEAAKSGNLEVINAELANGADVNFTLPNKNPKYGYLVQTALEITMSP